MAAFEIACEECGESNQFELPERTEPVEVESGGMHALSALGRDDYVNEACRNCGIGMYVYYE